MPSFMQKGVIFFQMDVEKFKSHAPWDVKIFN